MKKKLQELALSLKKIATVAAAKFAVLELEINELDKIFTDGAYTGQGYATCSTDANVAAKVVTIPHFLLLKNVPVSVLFTKAVDTPNATLNISSTGAKPIFYLGTAIQPDIIRPNMVVTLVYDGTNFNIVALEGLETSGSSSDLYVDMGLPSGLLWATRNIDVTQPNGFAASIYQYECSFFSWGNVDGHNPDAQDTFDYDFGTNNEGPYAQTPGAALTGNISPSFDAARVNCGAPWRLPTTEEYAELFNYITYIDANGDDIPVAQDNKLTTVNGVTGILLKSTVNGKTLFFPCTGLSYGSSWNIRGVVGIYWASSLYSQTSGRRLGFSSVGVGPQDADYRFNGYTARPVQ